MEFILFLIGLISLLAILGWVFKRILAKDFDDDFVPKFVGKGLIIAFGLPFLAVILFWVVLFIGGLLNGTL